VLGYWLSHPAVVDTSAAGAITVAGFALFLLSWLFAPRTGLITVARQRRRLSAAIDAENLVKAVEELRDGATFDGLAASLNEKPATLRSRLGEGIRRGWFKLVADRIHLTDAGRSESRRLNRAHQMWEQYLQQEVGLPPDHVHDAAEWIEHHLSGEKVDDISAELHKPPSAQ
jgi:manganese/zinc/iron transport system permease protein